MPSSWAASSNRVNRPFSRETTLAGGMSDDMAVKPTRSAKATVTSAKPSAMPCSPPRRRLAIGAGRTLQQLLVLAVLVLDLNVLPADVVDHAVEGQAKLADLVARAHRDMDLGVARREAPHAGGELAQRPQERARQ